MTRPPALSRRARAARRLRAEEGVAFVVVMGVMGVLLLLTAWVASGAETLSGSTNAGRDSKRALAAADAGLAVAAERLSRSTLSSNQCLSNVGASAVGTGECTAPTSSQTVSLGNNTSYRFLVSREVSGTTGCSSGHTPSTAAYERCITAVGRANGVERRVLRPVKTRVGLFTEAGVTGLNSLYFNNSTEFGAPGGSLVLGTNGQVTMVNSNSIQGTFLMPASAPAISSGSSSTGWTRTTRATAWEAEDVAYAIDKAWASNNNASLPSAVYNSSTRRFSIGSSERTLNGGTYVFCEFYAGSSAKLHFTTGQEVRIFIDSPLRAGSPCPAPTSDRRGRGRFVAHNSAEINWTSTGGERLHLVVAGTNDEANNPAHVCPDNVSYYDDVLLCNSVKMKGTIYAPNSMIRAVNSIEVEGALLGKNAYFNNSVKFFRPGSVGNPTLDLFSQREWYECKASPSTSTDPESGCTAP